MLYSDFVAESYGRECIKVDGGFMTYSVIKDCCHVDVLFVSRETRRRGVGRSLYAAMLEKLPQDVTMVFGEVDTRSRVANESLAAFLGFGFKILDLQGPYVRIFKRIRGD